MPLQTVSKERTIADGRFEHPIPDRLVDVRGGAGDEQGAVSGRPSAASDRPDGRHRRQGAGSTRISELRCCPFCGRRMGARIRTAQVTSAAFDNVAHTVTFAGLGTNNGLLVVFTIVAVDSSLVPPGSFSITLSD